jgi:hypothetical protein
MVNDKANATYYTIEDQNKVSKTLPGHTLMSLEHH